MMYTHDFRNIDDLDEKILSRMREIASIIDCRVILLGERVALSAAPNLRDTTQLSLHIARLEL